jgi:hypothetical protein
MKLEKKYRFKKKEKKKTIWSKQNDKTKPEHFERNFWNKLGF